MITSSGTQECSKESKGIQTASVLLSVVVPVYNEHQTIGQVIKAVLDVPLDLEVIVVDDGSSDGTVDVLKGLGPILHNRVRVLFHDQNKGKGAAIKTGLAAAKGELTVIQDADLEYDPDELSTVIAPIVSGESRVVYGSRYLAPSPGRKFRLFRYGVSFLNVIVRLIYGQRLTDSATCYKAAPTDLLRSLDLQCERFEFCPEMTSKLCRLGEVISEVPISYSPRSSEEGKKIRMRDGWEALLTYLRYRNWKPSK